MNSISVMACVQAEQPGFRSVYGRDNRMQQKYIRIYGQSERRSAAAGCSDTHSVSDRECENSRQNRFSAGNAKSANTSKAVRTERREEGLPRNKRTENRPVRSSRSRKTAARRGSALAIRTLVLAVIFAAMLAGFQMMTRASSREKEQTYKYYKTVTIGYGEDLSDIVFQYCDSSEYENADAYVREICDINSLPYQKGQVPDLGAGSKIVIPYFSTVLK